MFCRDVMVPGPPSRWCSALTMLGTCARNLSIAKKILQELQNRPCTDFVSFRSLVKAPGSPHFSTVETLHESVLWD